MSTPTTPVFFVHSGIQSYLKVPMTQATSCDNTVVLLGDPGWDSIDAEWHNGRDYLNTPDVQEFIKVYKHMSTNDAQIELICFLRWFAIKNYLHAHNLEKCFYVDSDAMIFFNADRQAKEFADHGAALSTPEYQGNYRWVTSGHTSYWTLGALEKLCQFFIDAYTPGDYLDKLKEKHASHIENNRPGGVVDMTLLYFFKKKYQDELNILNLSPVSNGSTFDDNFNTSEQYFKDEYMMDENKLVKKLRWLGETPYCYNMKTDAWVEFKSIHFQGGLKDQIQPIIAASKAGTPWTIQA